jgi:drug/metabolite transporter (DMT)-like permease
MGCSIVLEELGYLLMSLSFVFLAPVFAHQGRLASAVQWVFVAGFVLTTAILVVISVYYGLERIDRFEIAAISIDWLVLVVNGILLSVLFRRRLKQSRGAYARDNGDRDERGEGVP